jgi:hypothetical protein
MFGYESSIMHHSCINAMNTNYAYDTECLIVAYPTPTVCKNYE